MNISIFARYMGVLLSGVVALGVASCDEGGGNDDDDGDGGDDPSTSSSSASGSASSTGAGMGGGSSGAVSLIDNMEDAEGSILASEGRKGAWYIYNDETMGATQEPAMVPFTMAKVEPPRDGSTYAANTKGSGFMTWGAGFGFDLNTTGMTKSAYDASKYSGISFWAKIGAGTSGAVRFNIGDKNTAPAGGVCGTGKCDDDFGADLTLTETWQKFEIKFADMKQVGWSMAMLPAIEKSALYSVHFQSGAKLTFDIWVDDIGFFE
jgi:hypothetical protein